MLRVNLKPSLASRIPLNIRRFRHSGRKQKDIVVVGGGPAGLSLVSSLQKCAVTKHLDICLVDSQPLTEILGNWATAVKESPIENRVISLTPKSVKHLDEIDAWKHVVKDRIMPYDEMRVWDGASNANIEFDGWSSESGLMGTMIENSNLRQALYRSNQVAKTVVHSSVESIELNSVTKWPVVRLANGKEFETRLLVGADGQQSPVRKFAGIESGGWDYNRFGVVATMRLEYDNFRSIAYQRFLRTGPLAVLPLPNGWATLVWSTLPERAQWLKKLEPQAFTAMVNAGTRLEMVDIDYLHTIDPSNTDEIVGEVRWRLDQRDPVMFEKDDDGSVPVFVEHIVPGSVAGFPLRMRHADSYISSRVALVGDAAHATHPLSGQGLNMGQRDVKALVAAIVTAVQRGLDIGSVLALEPYPRSCYTANHVMLGVNDKLHKLYSTDFWPIVQLRSIGLNSVNMLGWLKQLVIQQAQ